MKTLITLLSLSLCLCAQGYVVIWKSKITVTETGGGTVAKRMLSGYVVYDLDAGTIGQIVAETARRNFWYRDLSSFDTSEVKTTQGKTYMVVSQATSDYDNWGNVAMDFTCVKGVESYVDIGDPLYNWLLPKTLQLTGRSLYSDGSGLPVLEESTGTLTLDKGTVNANFFGHTFDDVILAITQSYLNQGYTEL